MKRSDFRYFDRLRVRWAEVDAQKVVFNGHYLMYFGTAVAGYWRALALPYDETMAQLGGDTLTRKAAIEYFASAHYEDIVDIGVRCARVGTTSLTYSAAAFSGEKLLSCGEIVHVFIDPQQRVSKPLPAVLKECLKAYDAGELMFHVRLGSWSELGSHAQAIRAAVFIEEQHIPVEMEWDNDDAQCVHAVAYNRLGLPLATGRLVKCAPGVSKIGRMAVLRGLRGSRVGQAVLTALIRASTERGEHEVMLHAQLSAVPFYLRNGFIQRGSIFEEAGIPHIEMMRSM